MAPVSLQIAAGSLAVVFGSLACGLEVRPPNPAGTVTSLSGTLSAAQTATSVSLTGTAGVPSPAPALPSNTAAGTPAAPSATPQQPAVNRLALCWTGPGNAYPVVSSVKAGTPVEILGIGSVSDWFIIRNPKYHDLCWIEAKNIVIDPAFNLAQLRVFNPPPTPGPSETPVPTPT